MNRHILQLALCGGGDGSGTYMVICTNVIAIYH